MAIRCKTSLVFLIILVSLGLLSNGCTQHPAPTNTPAIPPSIAGYLKLQEEFGPHDFSVLAGRHIVLDPGHGGFFRGALGPRGLTEAEVNLGVALYLRGLLEWAGATVHLTRSADYDFLSLQDSTLASDLAFRSSLVNSLQPDVFISIHHNSTASRDPDVNETQTYYPLGDEGASLDLARSIHRHLVLNLEITPAKILPGNFHVLREATVPAVLGEPSMISNPVMEGRLSLAASHDLEAKAYFLGLLDYFSLGQPRWSGAAHDTLNWDPAQALQEVSWVFQSAQPGESTGPGPRPESFQLTLDGQNQAFHLSADGRTVTWQPAFPLSAGVHLLQLRGQNLKGRATPQRTTHLQVNSTTQLQVDLYAEANTPANQDNQCQPARTMLHWQSTTGTSVPAGFLDISSPISLLIPPAVEGWFLLPSVDINPDSLLFRPRNTDHIQVITPITHPNIPDNFLWRLITLGENPEFASSRQPLSGWRQRLGNLSSPRPGGFAPFGPAMLWQPNQPVWIEGKGLLPLVDNGQAQINNPRTVNSEFYLWRPRLLLPSLQGKTIILDPAGGGTVNDGTYGLGTRGADINLATALQAKDLLEGAGARVLLTRTGEVAPDAQQKVLMAGKTNADLFLTIGRATAGAQYKALHHPGSKTGIKWAQAMIQAFAPLDSLEIGQSYAYLLRHTACPALEIRLRVPQTTAEEMLVSSLPWQMAEGRAILLACTGAFNNKGHLPANLDPGQLIAGNPGGLKLDEIERARWDGNFSWQPSSFLKPGDTVTSFKSPGWPAGPGVHTLEIHAADQWQLWQVRIHSEETYSRETQPSAPQYQLLLENR